MFRADGDSNIGLGHVFRLLSLIELCKEVFQCVFVIRQRDNKLFELVSSYCEIFSISEDNEVEDMLELLSPSDILVLDGYNFGSDYQKKIKPVIRKLVMIDDTAEFHFYADLVINHGGDPIVDKYIKEDYTKLLTGFNYLIVRPEFLAAARISRSVSRTESVFICMGGADPFNVTLKAIRACMETGYVTNIIVVTGSAYCNKSELENLIMEGIKSKSITHHENISAAKMVELIGASQVAICPASSVALEVCCVKTGLLTGTVIANQLHILEQLINAGCCFSIGDFNMASAENIKTHLESIFDKTVINIMIEKQEKVIDGLSGIRILEEFKKLAD